MWWWGCQFFFNYVISGWPLNHQLYCDMKLLGQVCESFKVGIHTLILVSVLSQLRTLIIPAYSMFDCNSKTQTLRMIKSSLHYEIVSLDFSMISEHTSWAPPESWLKELLLKIVFSWFFFVTCLCIIFWSMKRNMDFFVSSSFWGGSDNGWIDLLYVK